MTQSTWSYITTTPEFVFIADLDGPKSVTNDAENVVTEILSDFPGRRIFYADSEGDLAELVHDGSDFTGWKSMDPTDWPEEIKQRVRT